MAQKILLLEDVESVGRKGEVASVKPGYAYNYLIPQGLALVANKSALRRQTRLKEERMKQAEIEKIESLELASKVNGETLEITVKVDQEGHLYGSVSALDIVHHLQTKTGIALDKKTVQIKHPYKEIGVFEIALKFKEGVTASITLKIIAQQEE
jgi:large subunit ribosomal protein L9